MARYILNDWSVLVARRGLDAGPQPGGMRIMKRCLLNRILKYKTEYTCGMSGTYYDVAQICLNGHVINERSKGYAKYNTKHCVDCGAKTITSCQDCEEEIRGVLIDSMVISLEKSPAPNYCHECGKPYPWTRDRIDAFQELVNSSSLKQDKKKILSDGIKHIISDTPQTKLTCVRFVSIISKQPLLKSALLDIAVKPAKEVLENLLDGAPLG